MADSFFSTHGISRFFSSHQAAHDAAQAAGVPGPYLMMSAVPSASSHACPLTYRVYPQAFVRTAHTIARVLSLHAYNNVLTQAERAISLADDFYRTYRIGSEHAPTMVGSDPDAGFTEFCVVQMDEQKRKAVRSQLAMHIRARLGRVRVDHMADGRYQPSWRRSISRRQDAVQLAQEIRDAIRRVASGETSLTDEVDVASDDAGLFWAIQRFEDRTGYRINISRLNDVFQDLDVVPYRDRITRFACNHVGVQRYNGESTADGVVCRDCFEADYVYVEDDEDYHHQNDVHCWADGTYHLEEEPDEYDSDDEDDEPPAYGADTLMDYSTNVLRYLDVDRSFVTTTHGDFHMGVELETIYSGSDHVNSKVRAVRAELGSEYLVAKRDGSLSVSSGTGIEWVTQPTSLAKHLRVLGDWKETRNQLTAWDPGCCGMHVHIDSKAFTPCTLGKLIQLYNDPLNAHFLRRIAGRHPDTDAQAKSFAARDVHGVVDSPAKALKGKNGSRYTMINLTNLSDYEANRLGLSDTVTDRTGRSGGTVEIRLFRASMKRERMLAQLEFAHAGVVFCRDAGFKELNQIGFTVWLMKKRVGQYPNLAKFLGLANKHGAQRATAVEAATDELAA